MKPNKKFATVAAAAMAIGGVAVAVSPSAYAADNQNTSTIKGEPLNAAGVVWWDTGNFATLANPGPYDTATVSASPIAGTQNINVSVALTAGPNASSFAGLQADNYQLEAVFTIGATDYRFVGGSAGNPAVGSGQPTFTSGTSLGGTISGLSGGSKTVTLKEIVLDSTTDTALNPLTGPLSGFDAIYSPSANPATVSVPWAINTSVVVPGPNATVSSITNQTATDYARAADVIAVGGSFWGNDVAVGGFTTTVGGAVATNTLSSGPAGGMIGGITVPVGATAGSGSVVITQGTNSTSIPITVLGARVISISPAAGAVGTQTTVTGSNWDTGQAVRASAMIPNPNGVCNVPDGPIGGAPCNDPVGNFPVGPFIKGTINVQVSGVASATGVIGGAASPLEVIVADPLTTQIQVNPPTGANASNTKALPWSFARTNCVVATPTTAVPNPNCGTDQIFTAVVNPGKLSQSAGLTGDLNGDNICQPATAVAPEVPEPLCVGQFAVNLGSVTTSTEDQSLSAAIIPITVVDARGGNLGWSLVASVATDFTSGSGASITQANLNLSALGCSPAAGSSAPVSLNPTGGAFTTPASAVTVCAVAPSGAGTSGGGKYVISGNANLTVPKFQSAGTYRTTMVFTLA